MTTHYIYRADNGIQTLTGIDNEEVTTINNKPVYDRLILKVVDGRYFVTISGHEKVKEEKDKIIQFTLNDSKMEQLIDFYRQLKAAKEGV